MSLIVLAVERGVGTDDMSLTVSPIGVDVIGIVGVEGMDVVQR